MPTELAIGGDRAFLIETDEQTEPLGIAKVLKCVAEAEKPGLVSRTRQCDAFRPDGQGAVGRPD
ncbi:hypothetical protein EB230_31355 [Mesorhizobium sp. NZP2234]|nr:hypothetical protein [Mesorhizobium sp. NZP2234]QKC92368.1 hypothetical protein EB230_31355 [Mesorhizobium sp. NZP2234]